MVSSTWRAEKISYTRRRLLRSGRQKATSRGKQAAEDKTLSRWRMRSEAGEEAVTMSRSGRVRRGGR